MQGPRLTRGGAAIRRAWPLYALGLVALTLGVAAELVTPRIIGWTVDLVTGGTVPPAVDRGGASSTLAFLLSVLCGALVVVVAGQMLARAILMRRSVRAAADLQNGVWDKVLRLEAGDALEPGHVATLMAADTAAASPMFGMMLMTAWNHALLLVLGLALMFAIDPLMAMAVLILSPLFPFCVNLLAPRQRTLHITAQASLGELAERFREAIADMRAFKMSGLLEIWKGHGTELTARHGHNRLACARQAIGIDFQLGQISLLALAVTLVLAVWRVRSGSLTPGELVAFLAYLVMVQVPLVQGGDLVAVWQRGAGSLDRVRRLLSLPDRAPPAAEVWDLGRAAVYAARDLEIVPGSCPMSFDVPAGQWIGVRGSRGARLIRTLAGLNPDYCGRLFVCGLEMRSMGAETLGRYVLYVPRETPVFSETVRNNVLLDRPASDEELRAVLDWVGLTDEIARMPSGVDTVLTAAGARLSGGQRQRLGLARALLRLEWGTSALILEGGLGAVDEPLEKLILGRLRDRFPFLTVIVGGERTDACDFIWEIGEDSDA